MLRVLVRFYYTAQPNQNQGKKKIKFYEITNCILRAGLLYYVQHTVA